MIKKKLQNHVNIYKSRVLGMFAGFYQWSAMCWFNEKGIQTLRAIPEHHQDHPARQEENVKDLSNMNERSVGL